MALFAAYTRDSTGKLIEKAFTRLSAFSHFTAKNKLKMDDHTTLIRLALINLAYHPPRADEVEQYQLALLLPDEFDDFWKKQLAKEEEEEVQR